MALFVRDLKIAEGQKIQYILRKSTRREAVAQSSSPKKSEPIL